LHGLTRRNNRANESSIVISCASHVTICLCVTVAKRSSQSVNDIVGFRHPVSWLALGCFCLRDDYCFAGFNDRIRFMRLNYDKSIANWNFSKDNLAISA